MSDFHLMLDELCPKCKPIVGEIINVFEKRISDLERRLAVFENAHTPSSQRRFQKRKDESGGGRKRGRPPGCVGSSRAVPEADRVEEVTVGECPGCGGLLGEPVRVESRVVEEIPLPQPVEVIDFRVHHYRCPQCGLHVEASHPECPSSGRFGPRTQAQITLLKYSCRLPHRKVVETLHQQFGLDVSAATVWNITRRVAEKLKPEYKQILQHIRASPVVYADETGFHVDGKKWWL